MYTATAAILLPMTIIGSLPRPGWYTENLGRRSFREAMVIAPIASNISTRRPSIVACRVRPEARF
jgi:hypothetical protein